MDSNKERKTKRTKMAVFAKVIDVVRKFLEDKKMALKFGSGQTDEGNLLTLTKAHHRFAHRNESAGFQKTKLDNTIIRGTKTTNFNQNFVVVTLSQVRFRRDDKKRKILN